MAHFRFVAWLVAWILGQTEYVFEWDEGNRTKSLQKHGVKCEEIEEVFEQAEAIRALGEQVRPPVSEPRYGILGLTKTGRHLFICFTIRGSGIRIVSAREMNQKERSLYVELCEK
jgi:uncharacterized DUF497 family protein